jgi:hypothetical protein
MIARILLAIVIAALSVAGPRSAGAQQPSTGAWRFVASGDSRNCGDVVMPGIAETAKNNQAAFFWHLGDLRAIYTIDEDIQHQPEHIAKPLSIRDYQRIAWPDFIASQIAPFGSIPFLVGIGNHEIMPSVKARDDFIRQFAGWLDTPVLRAQRFRDDPKDPRMRTYFHWIDRGVAFFSLDNATVERFDATQVDWFERVLRKDLADARVRTIVVGMHEPLPGSISGGMNGSPARIERGRHVYADLLRAQNVARKRVYILASHAHYYMAGIFNTDYWKQNGGVLPGWIVGTAGAMQYPLPLGSSDAQTALTNVYGSLVGTVQPGGEIHFKFQKLDETDIPAAVTSRYGREFVHWCFAENRRSQ